MQKDAGCFQQMKWRPAWFRQTAGGSEEVSPRWGAAREAVPGAQRRRPGERCPAWRRDVAARRMGTAPGETRPAGRLREPKPGPGAQGGGGWGPPRLAPLPLQPEACHLAHLQTPVPNPAFGDRGLGRAQLNTRRRDAQRPGVSPLSSGRRSRRLDSADSARAERPRRLSYGGPVASEGLSRPHRRGGTRRRTHTSWSRAPACK